MAGISTPAAFKRVNSATFFSGQRMDQAYLSFLAVNVFSNTLLQNETLMSICLYKEIDMERDPITRYLCDIQTCPEIYI